MSIIIDLVEQMEYGIPRDVLEKHQADMFTNDNYKCFGLKEEETVVAVSSAWLSTKHYSGRQIEVDNVVVDKETRSEGLGGTFLQLIEDWARDKGILSLELNTDVANIRSHKFYFDNGYHIVGYHYQKSLYPDKPVHCGSLDSEHVIEINKLARDTSQANT